MPTLKNYAWSTAARQFVRTALPLALVFCLPLFAQEGGLAFQATLTKASNAPGASTIFMDLPMPAAGQRLTIKRVSVKVGPALSPYTYIKQCYIESDRPAIPDTEFLQTRTRVYLKQPEYFTASPERFWYIRDEATLIYYDRPAGQFARTIFRLSCESHEVGPTIPFSVTVVGYTTPIPQ